MYSFYQNTRHSIRHLALSPNGQYLAITSTDKVIRVYETTNFKEILMLQDTVNKFKWKKCIWNCNSEQLCAATDHEQSEHCIYIWSRLNGSLLHILKSTKESLMDMCYHPRRIVLITCGSSGYVTMWSRIYVENWAAFAPDFQELQDNVEYIEKRR